MPAQLPSWCSGQKSLALTVGYSAHCCNLSTRSLSPAGCDAGSHCRISTQRPTMTRSGTDCFAGCACPGNVGVEREFQGCRFVERKVHHETRPTRLCHASAAKVIIYPTRCFERVYDSCSALSNRRNKECIAVPVNESLRSVLAKRADVSAQLAATALNCAMQDC